MPLSNNVIEVSEATFEKDVVQRSRELPVVVDFWAPWCVPCRMLGPILEKLAQEPGSGFVLAKVNVDQNQSLSWRFQVQGIPAVKAFVDGEVAGEFVGARPEPFIRQFLAELAPTPTDDDLSAGQAALADRRWRAAAEAFQRVLDESPQQPDATLGLAKALLARGQGVAAERLLKALRTGSQYVEAEKLRPMADYLVAAELEWKPDAETTPLEAAYRHVATLLRRANLEAALDGLLDVLRQDKRYRRGQAKDVALGIIELLGAGDKTAQRYRTELATVLY